MFLILHVVRPGGADSLTLDTYSHVLSSTEQTVTGNERILYGAMSQNFGLGTQYRKAVT